MTESNGLPKGWVKTTVTEVGRVQLGRQRSPKNHSGTHMRPYLRVANVFEDRIDLSDVMEMNFTPAEYEIYKLHDGDILLNEGQSMELVGRPAMYRDELPGCCFTNSLVRFQPSSVLDNRFALYVFLGYLKTGRFQKIATITVNIAHLGAGRFGALEFWLPPLPEQHRIVEKIEELFSDLDAGVASLQRAKANLKRYRASVMKSAVEGRLTEEWRNEHPQTEDGQMLLDRILRERREKWEKDQLKKFKEKGKEPPKNWESKYEEPSAPNTSELPALPEGWAWARVEQLGDVQLGRQRSPKTRSDKYPTKYIRSANLTETGLDLGDVMDMEFLPHEKETYRLHGGDILLAEASGSPDQVGKPVIWNNEIDDCCFQNTVIRLRPHGLPSAFPFLVFRQYYISKLFARASAGVGINHLSANKFAALSFPLPPLAEQEQIVALVEERVSQIDSAEKTIDAELIRSKRLRQSILKRAFEGKLVPQDPKDEPAGVLLERIKASRETEQPKKNKKTKAKAK
jgi:type I restriction enzyme S subunit